MYIVYSNNLGSCEVHPRGPQYAHKQDAVNNLLKEVQNYLLTYKRVENHKIVNNMNYDNIVPDIVWYIEQPDDREHEIILYKVVQEPTQGWLRTTIEQKIEKHMTFGIMDLPNRPVNFSSPRSCEKRYIVPDSPTVSHSELMIGLRKAIEQRKEKIEEMEKSKMLTPLQKEIERRRKLHEN